MRLYEHEAKRVLSAAGVKVPRRYAVLDSVGKRGQDPFVRSTLRAYRQKGPDPFFRARYPAMVKAQVLVGGRGKAGGIRRVANGADAADAVCDLLARHIGGYPVRSVLVEEALESTASCYLGVTINPATFNTVVLASAEGGVDIEEAARARPETVLRAELPENPPALPTQSAREIASFLAHSLSGPRGIEDRLATVASTLYDTFQTHDCKVLEVNPLLITSRGPVAADAKMVLDDNALYRQTKLLARLKIAGKRHEVAEPTERERRAFEAGFPYVDLLGEHAEREPGKVYVGLVPGGAGYGIFAIDEVTGIGELHFGGRVVPVNFMDSGGGPTREGVAEMFDLLMDYPLVDLIITSRFGGISSCDVFIRGLVDCLRRRRAEKARVVPVYGRMVGTDLPAARAFLESARRETPEPLEVLSMVVGNRRIMAEVIREALTHHLSGSGEGTR
ncbi:MAG TPA: ATP-grasp domain-containing protein [Planctomycetota bacterium]|nr:ATP-grasp domain-containing protein [Planctomycetota bacterium]